MTDRSSGKITLAVRLGERGSKVEYIALLAGAYVLLPIFWLGGWQASLDPPAPIFTAPGSLPGKKIRTSVSGPAGGASFNRLLASTAKLSLYLQHAARLGTCPDQAPLHLGLWRNVGLSKETWVTNRRGLQLWRRHRSQSLDHTVLTQAAQNPDHIRPARLTGYRRTHHTNEIAGFDMVLL